jgi:transcriptional regulator with XRE-family HTH domain
MILTVKDNGLTAHQDAHGKVEQVTAAVAARVRRLRTARGWSLDELAGRSGVSKGMLVQIEGARTNPSLGTLCRVADAFGVDMTLLLEEATERLVRIADVAHAPRLWTGPDGGSARLIGGTAGAGIAELWQWELFPGEEQTSPDHAPGTRELIHVLDGELTVTVDAVQYVVMSGQSIEYLANRPHGYANRAGAPCRLEMLVTAPSTEHDRRA